MRSSTHVRPARRPIRFSGLLSFVLLGWLAAVISPAGAARPAATTPEAPRLVVVLVVDGLPQEQVQRYRNQFGPGGFRRLLDHGAWYGNGHQAQAVTLTAVGHAAILTGAYPYQHGVIGNGWVDRNTMSAVYCTEDAAYVYLGEETRPRDGTSPANLRVATLGDELRYGTGGQAKVVAVSGKDRGAILLAGKAGTAYMYMGKSGRFATSSYYMKEYPEWHRQFYLARPQDRFFGKQWTALLKDAAYAGDAPDGSKGMDSEEGAAGFPMTYGSKSGIPDAEYYRKLFVGPYLDELTLDFARAAIDGEQLGRNPSGATDLLGVSLSSHDYINHGFGPESRLSHDHLLRLDRQLAAFFDYLEKQVGLDKTLVVLTADHGFANVPEFARAIKRDAQRLDPIKMMESLNAHLATRFTQANLAAKWFFPNVMLDYALIESKGLRLEDVENAAARFLLGYPGVAHSFTRSQLETGALPATRLSTLVQRTWNRSLSGDIVVIARPYWYFAAGTEQGTSHGSPYTYDTHVPLMLMGKPWIRPGAYGQYAEVVDLAPTLAYLLRVRPPAASEGRVLTELLRSDPVR